MPFLFGFACATDADDQENGAKQQEGKQGDGVHVSFRALAPVLEVDLVRTLVQVKQQINHGVGEKVGNRAQGGADARFQKSIELHCADERADDGGGKGVGGDTYGRQKIKRMEDRHVDQQQ